MRTFAFLALESLEALVKDIFLEILISDAIIYLHLTFGFPEPRKHSSNRFSPHSSLLVILFQHKIEQNAVHFYVAII